MSGEKALTVVEALTAVMGDEWDAASSGAVQGAASDEPTPLYDQCLDDLDFAAWERQVST